MMQTLNPILFAAAVIATLLLVSVVLLLRRLATGQTSSAPIPDIEWYRPMQRLLDPGDLAFLSERGVSRSRIHQVRAERRKIFRLYFQSLVRDYRRVEIALSTLLVECTQDRPDLAADLFRRKLAFYRAVFAIEFRLTLHALGANSMPRLELLESFEKLLGQFRQMTPASELAY
jgi:hypothetical protein